MAIPPLLRLADREADRPRRRPRRRDRAGAARARRARGRGRADDARGRRCEILAQRRVPQRRVLDVVHRRGGRAAAGARGSGAMSLVVSDGGGGSVDRHRRGARADRPAGGRRRSTARACATAEAPPRDRDRRRARARRAGARGRVRPRAARTSRATCRSRSPTRSRRMCGSHGRRGGRDRRGARPVTESQQISRREARRAAVFLLYQWDVTGTPLASLYEGEVDDYTRRLAEAVSAHAPRARRADHGRVGRMDGRPARRAGAEHPPRRDRRAGRGRRSPSRSSSTRR